MSRESGVWSLESTVLGLEAKVSVGTETVSDSRLLTPESFTLLAVDRSPFTLLAP